MSSAETLIVIADRASIRAPSAALGPRFATHAIVRETRRLVARRNVPGMALERLDLDAGAPVEAGSRRVDGIAVIALAPDLPANRAIVDLNRARRDGDGLVRFETDVVLLRAPRAG